MWSICGRWRIRRVLRMLLIVCLRKNWNWLTLRSKQLNIMSNSAWVIRERELIIIVILSWRLKFRLWIHGLSWMDRKMTESYLRWKNRIQRIRSSVMMLIKICGIGNDFKKRRLCRTWISLLFRMEWISVKVCMSFSVILLLWCCLSCWKTGKIPDRYLPLALIPVI